MLGYKDQNNRCFKNFKGKLYKLLKLCVLEPSQSRSINSCAKSQNNRRAPSKEEGLPLKCNLWGTVRHCESLKIAIHKLCSLSIFTELSLKFLMERSDLLMWFENQYDRKILVWNQIYFGLKVRSPNGKLFNHSLPRKEKFHSKPSVLLWGLFEFNNL